MSALNFHTKPSVRDSGVDFSDIAFVWASRNVRGRDAVEEFMSYGVWPLAADVSFENVKVDLTPVLKFKIPLPRFPLCHKDEEDDARFLARVEQGARSLPCQSSQTQLLESCARGGGSGLRASPGAHFRRGSKERKADATVTASAKRLKVPKKKGADPARNFGARASGGSKRPSGATVVPAQSVKLSKGIVPRAIASAAATRITPKLSGPGNLLDASGSRAGDGGLSCTTMPGTKKGATSTKKRIILAIGALAAISSEGTQESSPHDEAPKIQLKAGPRH
jgi:hypothetical protein